MNLLKQVIAGTIGGLIGALIWAGISYATNYEIGWIAWGIGFLVGFCVRWGAGETQGTGPGVVAAGLAMGAVLLGKAMAIYIALSSLGSEFQIPEVTAADMQQAIAHEILEERQKAGQPVVLPGDKSPDDIETMADFPPDVQSEAEKRWNDLPPDQQQQQMADRKKEYEAIREIFVGNAWGETFLASFGVFDLLWFGLAAFTAFKLGSGHEG